MSTTDTTNVTTTSTLGRIWWIANSEDELARETARLTAAGARIVMVMRELEPDVLHYVFELERSRAKDILGYEPDEAEWLAWQVDDTSLCDQMDAFTKLLELKGISPEDPAADLLRQAWLAMTQEQRRALVTAGLAQMQDRQPTVNILAGMKENVHQMKAQLDAAGYIIYPETGIWSWELDGAVSSDFLCEEDAVCDAYAYWYTAARQQEASPHAPTP